MKTCLILTGTSETIDLDFAGSFLKHVHYDMMIAVDAGLEAARKLNMIPSMAVGDFDTVSSETLQYHKNLSGIIWDGHNSEKDETDTELAIIKAISLECEEIFILGATGGRMDHTIGNIHLLRTCLKNKVEGVMLDPKNKIYLIDEKRSFQKSKIWGRYLSFLPLTNWVKGITLSGFRYPLNKKDIEIGTSLCISNELSEEYASVELEEGILICIESHD